MKIRPLEIRFRTAFHHGSGFGIAGLLDRAVLRDSRGMPYLAGSAIKGKFRHAALRLLLTSGERACHYGDNPKNCGPCPLCLIFGSRLKPGTLLFSDAFPNEDLQAPLSSLHDTSKALFRDSHARPGIALDRGLGVTRRHLLFSTETLPPFLAFRGEIRGDLGDSALESLLSQAAQVLTHFGAGSSHGLGSCEYRILEES
jgi:CRISPR/Cas system CSM-associated protein Csm3 (group 7 of RAMP superfamily)